MNLSVLDLSPDLFWDVSPSDIDLTTHKKWLLERILELGRWEDWLLVADEFNKQELADLEPALNINPKSRNFLRVWINNADAP